MKLTLHSGGTSERAAGEAGDDVRLFKMKRIFPTDHLLQTPSVTLARLQLYTRSAWSGKTWLWRQTSSHVRFPSHVIGMMVFLTPGPWPPHGAHSSCIRRRWAFSKPGISFYLPRRCPILTN